MSVTENEILRESRRIFRKLVGGAVLQPCADGAYAATRRGKNASAAKTKVARAVVAEWTARGLLCAVDAERFAISEAGRHWYRRIASDAPAEPYAAQHRLMEKQMRPDEDGVHRSVSVNLNESPLAYLHHRKLIDGTEFDAGERLRRDYTLAHAAPRMCMDWDRAAPAGRRRAGPGPVSDNVLAAKQRFSAALAAVGPELSGLLFDLCCELHGLEETEKYRGWPRASAKVVLRLGLGMLARHYGLGAHAAPQTIRHWRAPENAAE